MFFALSWGPPFLEPKKVTNQQFYKETVGQKNRCCVFLGGGLSQFSYIYFIKNKISKCLNGVYVKGSSEVWQWSRLSCIHFSEKQITWCCYRVYVKGNRSPKKLHRIQNAEGSMISALSWGPPFLEPKNITNQQSYKETFVQKKEVVFCFFPGYPDFLASTF